MFLFLYCLLLASVAHGGHSTGNLTVQTTTGTFTGIIDPGFPSTRQFRSIPFAEPPVTSRRWLPPKKLAKSAKHHYSYNFPPSCPQFVSSTPTVWTQFFGDVNLIDNGSQNHSSGLSGENTSEDCLNLAIWTPKNATSRSKLPVLFFMTGGGFAVGGVNIKWQLPAGWVDRTQQHIVVTINYRLNIFGWPNARGLRDQNLGLMDQRMALEWVRDNIANFGGDPDAITQWGQSAGSMSTDYHSYAYYKDPIASGYFMQSGTALLKFASSDTTHSNFTFVAKHFGCDFPDDGQAELECMRQVPFAMIENFIGQYTQNGTEPALSFVMVPDEKLIFSNYTERAMAGKVAKSPVLTGNTANEATSLVPWPVNNLTAGPWQPGVLALDLAMWICPAAETTKLRSQLDIPVYRYQYAGQFPNLTPYSWLGAYHAGDLSIVFGTYDLTSQELGNSTALEVEVSRAVQDHVLAFVKDPYKGPQSIGWNAVKDGGKVVRFGADGKVVQYVDINVIDGACSGNGTYDQFP